MQLMRHVAYLLLVHKTLRRHQNVFGPVIYETGGGEEGGALSVQSLEETFHLVCQVRGEPQKHP